MISPLLANIYLRVLATEFTQAAMTVGISHATPHMLRHTYAAAQFQLRCLGAGPDGMLGHVSAEVSLRYAPTS